MREIETMMGNGTVRGRDGQAVQVRYELHVYQDDIPAGTLHNPRAAVPGLKEIRGIIKPVCFFGEDNLVLAMEDGRKLKFFFTNVHGSARGSGEPSV